MGVKGLGNLASASPEFWPGDSGRGRREAASGKTGMNIANPMESLSRPALAVELTDRLRGLIMEGELKPGEKIPERLLTGEHVEPAFLITKPFDPETLKIAIGQALSLSTPAHALRN